MRKTVLITGATDGIGLKTAERLLAEGCRIFIHGRNPDKLAKVRRDLVAQSDEQRVVSFRADLSRPSAVEALAAEILNRGELLDAVIHNAGVFKVGQTRTEDGLDVRFAVNTLAPYLLTQRLWSLLPRGGRVVNVSSAAQAPVDLAALRGQTRVSDNAAYAQSKLALTMMSHHLAEQSPETVIVAVNPGSLLASKMVKQAYGIPGSDLSIGAEILTRAALSESFADASGRYWDNDSKRFAPGHPDAADPAKRRAVVETLETLLTDLAANQAP